MTLDVNWGRLVLVLAIIAIAIQGELLVVNPQASLTNIPLFEQQQVQESPESEQPYPLSTVIMAPNNNVIECHTSRNIEVPESYYSAPPTVSR